MPAAAPRITTALLLAPDTRELYERLSCSREAMLSLIRCGGDSLCFRMFPPRNRLACVHPPRSASPTFQRVRRRTAALPLCSESGCARGCCLRPCGREYVPGSIGPHIPIAPEAIRIGRGHVSYRQDPVPSSWRRQPDEGPGRKSQLSHAFTEVRKAASMNICASGRPGNEIPIVSSRINADPLRRFRVAAAGGRRWRRASGSPPR